MHTLPQENTAHSIAQFLYRALSLFHVTLGEATLNPNSKALNPKPKARPCLIAICLKRMQTVWVYKLQAHGHHDLPLKTHVPIMTTYIYIYMYIHAQYIEILYCNILDYMMVCYIVLYSILLYYIILYDTIFGYIILYVILHFECCVI